MATVKITVDTFEDQNDGSKFEGWSLRDAILAANADPSKKYEILLPVGTYELTIKDVLAPNTDASADEATLFRSRLGTGDLDITGNVTIIGFDPDNPDTTTNPEDVIIDASGLLQNITFAQLNLPEDAILPNSGTNNGDSLNDDPFEPEIPPDQIVGVYGDRVFDVLPSLALSGSSNSNTNGSLTLENVTVTNGLIGDLFQVTVIRPILDENDVPLRNPDTGEILTEEQIFTIQANIDTIPNGGAINIETGTEATIINSIISNSESSGQGGGINNAGILTLEKTIIDGNNSGDNAGGIYNTGTITVRDSAIINNIADAAASNIIEGGGGGILNEAGAVLIMINTTVSGNRSASENDTNPDNIPTGPGDGGGGILNRGTSRIINSTIVNNSAQVGSGIYSETTGANTILYNTIVADNTGSPDLDGFFDPRSGFNLVSNANGSILDANNGNIVGGDTTQRVDLKLGPLQDNGGPTPTHALLPDSLAINAGDVDLVNILFYFPEDPPLDQRGSERISNGKIDIGAYEVFVQSTQSQTTVNNSTNTNTTITGVNTTSTGTFDDSNIDTTSTGVNTTNTGTSDDSNVDTTNTGVNTTNTGTSDDSNVDTTNTGVNTTNTPTEDSTAGNTETTTGGTLNDNAVTGVNIPDSNQEVIKTETTNSLLNDPLFRFQNSQKPGTYLFAGEAESQTIRRDFVPPFMEEGFAFNVSLEQQDGLARINRFQSTQNPGTYLFASEAESIGIRSNHSNTFFEEGVAFYAYGADANIGEDVFRYQSKTNPGTYLFVLAEEKSVIDSQFASQFKYEGVAFEVTV